MRIKAIMAATVVVLLAAQAIPLAVLSPAMAATKPNIVVVMVDDMDPRMVDYLPRLQSLLTDKGLSFSSFYVAAPVCCPSRASFLRAQYPHNTGVLANGPPQGGLSAFRNRGNDQSTIATWLRDAGYRTALIGKYLNDYEKSPKHVAPGWDRWFVYAGKGKYTNFLMSDQGKVRAYGKKNGKKKTKKRQYQTDLLTRRAVDFINTTNSAQPLFLFLSPATPHEPAIPAARHKRAPVAIDHAPRLPSFNEADLSDKPGWLRNEGLLSAQRINDIDALYVKQLRSMLSVEDMIANVMGALSAKGRLDNTYIFFVSDNGFHHGEHRIPTSKNMPYEESARSPLLVVGPGVPAGVTTDAMSSMVDLGPTFAELAGTGAPNFVDGRSLVDILHSGDAPGAWRDSVISELAAGPGGGFILLRSNDHAYVEYGSGDRELYDLDLDPYQLDNIYSNAPAGLIDDLEEQLNGLRHCGIDGPSTCQDVDGG